MIIERILIGFTTLIALAALWRLHKGDKDLAIGWGIAAGFMALALFLKLIGY